MNLMLNLALDCAGAREMPYRFLLPVITKATIVITFVVILLSCSWHQHHNHVIHIASPLMPPTPSSSPRITFTTDATRTIITPPSSSSLPPHMMM
ncbi:hypothetical protein E3N88_19023 [Mikania micrantha]|uniref:Uncharacterized protein n=1 Tax=Mikania micrantha TaxID=192012 RepID=A0A5N6NQ13_9ASTR|nr:hypothetical protein E3N88_19023 [Mikania micrantha]